MRFPWIAFVLLLLLAGCQRNDKPVVGVVPKGTNHIFWQTVHAGAIKAAREYNMEVEWNAPTLETDSSRQIAIVESMVNRRLAGIVLAPVDRKALVPVVERAASMEIPVAVFDSGIDTTKRLTYVATDNVQGGRLAAQRIAELLNGKGKVGVIGFKPGSASTMDRESGFARELQKYPGIQLLPIQFGEADRAKAMARTENMLAANPDLGAVFADNESSSSGAVQAFKGRQAHQVKLVAFDASEQLVQDLREGWIDSLVVQDPFKMGYESTKAVGMKRQGQTPPELVDTGVKLIKKEDLNKPEVKALLFPDLKPYLGSTAAGH